MRFCSKGDVYFNIFNMHEKSAERRIKRKFFTENRNLICP